jgi:hypothetical protein
MARATTKTTAKTEEPKKEAPPPFVMFESRSPESAPFEVAGIRPIRDFATGRLLWRVKTEDVERFSAHHHVVTNRVRRAAS